MSKGFMYFFVAFGIWIALATLIFFAIWCLGQALALYAQKPHPRKETFPTFKRWLRIK